MLIDGSCIYSNVLFSRSRFAFECLSFCSCELPKTDGVASQKELEKGLVLKTLR